MTQGAAIQDLGLICEPYVPGLQAALEEKARAAKEKELETARLRAKQERAADRQAEIDELRARRYTPPHTPAFAGFPLRSTWYSCNVQCHHDH